MIITLICKPGQQKVSVALAQSLCAAWGGGDVRWLNALEACEFEVPHAPDNQWDVWQDLQNIGVDLVAQPAMERRKKILLADMDSTMIQQECIDELAEEAGVGARVKDITARAMNGELDFNAALKERVKLLAGLPETIILDVLNTRITLMDGATELLATMKRDGAYAALVSGGFTAFTSSVAKTLGFDENRANSLLIKDGKLTGETGLPILGKEAKVSALEDITKQLGLSHTDVMAVGDGANDLGMLTLAGAGVALHAKPNVARECEIRINHGDLTALLYIQGYRKEDFADA